MSESAGQRSPSPSARPPSLTRFQTLWRFPKTLFGKVSFVFSIMLLLFAGFQVMLTVHFWSRSLDKAEQLSLWSSAEYLAGVLSSQPGGAVDLGNLDRAAFAFSRANPKASIYILDQHGGFIYHFISSDSFSGPVNMEPINRFFKEGTRAAPIYGSVPGSPQAKSIFSAAWLTIRQEKYILYVLFNNESWRNIWIVSFEDAMGASAVLSTILSALAVFMLGIFLFRLLARRFAKITHTVERFHEGDFTPRIGFTDDDELGILGASIDEMAVRIQQSISELQERDRLRRELVANVSHDLRGPLHNIRGNLNVFRSDSGTAAPSGELLAAIERNVSYLGDLLNQLFELAKLEAQEAQPDFEEFPLDQLLDDLRISYASRAAERGIRLEAVFHERPIFVSGDIRMLDRVMLNLVENAMKFTPNGGTIGISLEPSGSRVVVSVSDTGSGIAEKDLHRVLEKSYQGENAPKERGSSGLGLTIVDRVLKLHGSRLQIKTRQNEGTTFSFELERLSSS